MRNGRRVVVALAVLVEVIESTVLHSTYEYEE